MEIKQKNRNSSQSAKKSTITIGYYNLRGKAQVCRLLCQYLGVDYEDKLFTLQQWDKYKKDKTKKWIFSDLPFLQEGDFTVTEPIPMCVYIITRFGNHELLGRNLIDKSIVDMYIWTIQTMGSVIALNCQKMKPQELQIFKEKQWKQTVSGRLQKYQSFAKEDNFFLGYLTIIDFSIYEVVRYMDMIFPGKINKFQKLVKIKQMIQQLPAIKAYEQSPRAIKVMCPSKLLEELKNRKTQQ